MASVNIQISDTKNTFNVGSIESVSLKGALTSALNEYPVLYTKIILLEHSALIAVKHNNSFVNFNNEDTLLEDGDVITIELHELPTGNSGLVGSTTINAVFGAGTVAKDSFLAAVVGSILISGTLMALNMLVGALIDDTSQPSIMSGTVDNSQVYTFDGIKNTTVEGTPIQLVYGTHRVGGHLLAVFTSSTESNSMSPDETLLYMHIGVSEGEITSITDVEINKFPYNMYDAVTTTPTPGFVVLGCNPQDVLLDFSQTHTAVAVQRLVGNFSADMVNIEAGLDMYGNAVPLYGYVKDDYSVVIGKNSCSVLVYNGLNSGG